MAKRTGPPSLWFGNDKVRVGERLQASLAGLLELQLLKELQRSSVEEALGKRPPEWQQGAESKKPSGSKKEDRVQERDVSCSDRSWSEDILKGSRKFPVLGILELDSVPRTGLGSEPEKVTDVGPNSSLWLGRNAQLFPQSATDAQAERRPHPGEPQDSPETDSRPSSGFYEISDVGSSSLSDSCMSVCSSCPGGSRWSMNSLSQLPLVRESGFPRPRSTDEAAVRLQDPGVPGLFGASGAQCLAGHIYGQRPGSRRPVSTGDLEFLPPAPHLTELSAPSQQERSPQLQLYACDLVSHATSDVYRYPSPLHAVALQSPLFASLPQEELPDGQDSAAPGNRPTLPSQSCFSPELHRCRVERYISKLVLRHRCRSALTRSELTLLAGQQKSLSLTSVCSGQPLGSPPGLSLPPRPASTGWKVRRRISTCSHLRPLDSPEDPRDSRAPRCYSVNSQESGSVGSSTTDVSKVSDLSLGSLLEDLTLFREPAASPAPKPDRCRSLREPAGPEHGVFSGKWSSLKCGRETGKLYRGKHASQELVRAPESRPGPEHSWLSPRELLRRISTRRKPAPRGNGCCRSEVDVNAVAARRAGGCGSPPWEERGPPRQKWASVQEICSSSAPALPRKRAQRGPARLLSRHLSTDSPLHFCQQHGRVRLWEQAAGPGLGEVDATSSCSLAGDWIQQAVWMKGMAPATLDAGNVAGASFKLHRTRSLKELRRMVCRSMKPFSLGGQASSR